MTASAETRRDAMVARQIAARGIRDARLLAAMRTVPRELFVPADLAEFAYSDTPLPIAAGQTISQPYIVAWMIDAARIAPDDCVLEVGAGSGYAAAVLSRLADQVFAIERHAELAHAAELRLWKVAGVDPTTGKGSWYRETGSGMGPTLNTAAGMNAYAMTDRGTWLNFKNRGNLAIVVEGDKRLFNQYGVMLVNPAKHPHVKKELGATFIEWVTSPEGQKAIADYKIGGEQLFFPNYKQSGA